MATPKSELTITRLPLLRGEAILLVGRKRLALQNVDAIDLILKGLALGYYFWRTRSWADANGLRLRQGPPRTGRRVGSLPGLNLLLEG